MCLGLNTGPNRFNPKSDFILPPSLYNQPNRRGLTHLESRQWQSREPRASPAMSWAAGTLASPELSSRYHGKSCLGYPGVCPGGSRHIWGMAPGRRDAWPPGWRMEEVHFHWPSSFSLSGSPFVHPGLGDKGTVPHQPSFTRKGAEDRAWEVVSSGWLLLQPRDGFQRPLVWVEMRSRGQISFGEGGLMLTCFYLLYPGFCPPPPLP